MMPTARVAGFDPSQASDICPLCLGFLVCKIEIIIVLTA